MLLRRITTLAVLLVVCAGCAQTKTAGGFTDGATNQPTSTTVAAVAEPAPVPVDATDGIDVEPSTDPTATTTAPSGPEGLSGLVIAAEHLDGSYDRDLYPHWGTGPLPCSVRVEVLVRDSVTRAQVDMGGRCAVWPGGGDWYSPYDDRWFDDPAEIQIDHFVPLAEAHRSGAWAWDPARREAFANDLTNPHTLIAVSGSSNQSKSDGDPADWLPTNRAFHCEYIRRWVDVKLTWGLTVDQFEYDTIVGTLAGCDNTAWATPPVTAAAPATAGPPAPDPAPDRSGAAPCQPGQVKGNRNSSIYHVPGGDHYARTSANVECFDTAEAAGAAGYRPVRG